MENELVILKNGKATTTSLKAAEVFEKRHDNVLRDIENLECSQELRLLNFGESNYLNKQNKTMPMYDMARDGFMFLAMGFTGGQGRALRLLNFEESSYTVKSPMISRHSILSLLKSLRKT